MNAGSGSARWARLEGRVVIPLSDAEAADVLAGRKAPLWPVRVAWTEFPSWRISISTLFTGLRMGGSDGRPSLWFETTILGGGDDLTRQHWRHATYFDAIDAHHAVIDAVMRAQWGRAWDAFKKDEARGRGRVAASR